MNAPDGYDYQDLKPGMTATLMVRKSQVDVMADITRRATESLEEARKLMRSE